MHCICQDSATHDRLRQYGDGSLEYEDVLYGWTHPDEVEEVPGCVGVIAGPRAGDARQSLRTSGVGLCTWQHRYYYGLSGGWVADGYVSRSVGWLVDSAQVGAGLVALAGLSLAQVSDHPPLNTRNHRGENQFRGPDDYADWYTDESLGWVADADAPLIALMGWPGPFVPAPLPVVEVGS